MALLDRISFNSRQDKLWFTGDLVNKGPNSLHTIRWIVKNQHCCESVLGNHDLYLLGRYFGVIGAKKRDSIDDILDAPDCRKLIKWLRNRPLLLERDQFVVVHAGIYPHWNLLQVKLLCKEVESILRSNHVGKLIYKYFNGRSQQWQDRLSGYDRWVTLLKIITQIRVCNNEGEIMFKFSGPPDDAPKGFAPWFTHAKMNPLNAVYLFGHWASLGLYRSAHFIGLDTGCVNGKVLSAIRLDDRAIFQVASAEN